MQALERSPAVSYILDAAHCFVHCNRAWDNFAAMNGAPHLTGESVIGLSIFDVIAEVLMNFYSDAFERARKVSGKYPMNAPAGIGFGSTGAEFIF